MTEFSQLLTGIALTSLSIGSLIFFCPRRGKMAWFVGMPFLDAGVPILMIGIFAIGILLIAFSFTAVDDATLSGMAKRL